MKKLEINGKLKLNKETIAQLNDKTMSGVKGGGPLTVGDCETSGWQTEGCFPTRVNCRISIDIACDDQSIVGDCDIVQTLGC